MPAWRLCETLDKSRAAACALLSIIGRPQAGQAADNSISDRAGSSAQQVDDQDHKRNHKQQMDQATRHMQAETQKP
jgi:hypothetical protein